MIHRDGSIFRKQVLLALAVMLCLVASARAAERKIVLIAGPITGHPKEAHEYEKNVILLKQLLDTSPNLRGARTEVHFKGWPEDERTLDDADTIVLTSDGGDRNPADHPLYVSNRLATIERQMKRGCGFVHFHWTTFNPAVHHDQITEWVGGYFDYETGPPPRNWYSAIKTWTGPVTFGPEHPILRGVKPFEVQEEFYYNLKFRDNDPRLKPIVLTRPPGETKDFTVGWAVERAEGGRGFGYTGGHFYKNWWLPDYRKLILNAIAWTAKLEVPADGVESKLEDRYKVLILTGHQHPGHDWKALSVALLGVLEQDPRVQVEVTENIEDLATKKLSDYAALVMNYNNWELGGLSDASKGAFTNYLNNGGGLSIIHFANGAFTDTVPNPAGDWLEYRTRIVRRIWVHGQGNSGHDAFGPFTVTPTTVTHPITAGLKPFDTKDELYFRQMGELPIEPLATAHSKVTGKDEPMAWAYTYGKGRIFQTVLGHADESVRAAGALIRRGTVWAAQRENLGFDPPTRVTENLLFRQGSQWTPKPAEAAKPAAAAPPKSAK